MSDDIAQHHAQVTSLLVPYLENPALIFGGSYYSRRVIDASRIIAVLDANPDLDLGHVDVPAERGGDNKPISLIGRFMDEAGSLGSLMVEGRRVAGAALGQIGIDLIGRHGCNPWKDGISRTMISLNRITMLPDAPLDFVKAVIGHGQSPAREEIGEWISANKSRDFRNYERPPLHHACVENRVDLAQFWLGMGFDVNARDGNGDLPIALASSPEMARALLVGGSSIEAVDRHGQGVMDAWGTAGVSASLKETMGKEVSRGVDDGLVQVDRALLLEMVRNDTGRRKVEELLRAAGIGWWDEHEDGSIARLALVDFLTRYRLEPKFVQSRMASLVASACDWARRESVDIPEVDLVLLQAARDICGMDKIKAARPGGGIESIEKAFSMVFKREGGALPQVVAHARLWHENGMMPASGIVDLVGCMHMAGMEKLREARSRVDGINSDFPGDDDKDGRFVHMTLPQMIENACDQHKAMMVPFLVALSSDLMGRTLKTFVGGKKQAGGIQQALMGMHMPTLAPMVDTDAMERSMAFFNENKKLFSSAAQELVALDCALKMGAQVDEPGGSRRGGPRF